MLISMTYERINHKYSVVHLDFQLRLVCSTLETVLPFNVCDMIWYDITLWLRKWHFDPKRRPQSVPVTWPIL